MKVSELRDKLNETLKYFGDTDLVSLRGSSNRRRYVRYDVKIIQEEGDLVGVYLDELIDLSKNLSGEINIF